MNFWRRMGRRHFYAVVDVTEEMLSANQADDPESFKGWEEDPWVQAARARREEQRGR